RWPKRGPSPPCPRRSPCRPCSHRGGPRSRRASGSCSYRQPLALIVFRLEWTVGPRTTQRRTGLVRLGVEPTRARLTCVALVIARGGRGKGAVGLAPGCFPAGARRLDDAAGRIGGGGYTHFTRVEQDGVGRGPHRRVGAR